MKRKPIRRKAKSNAVFQRTYHSVNFVQFVRGMACLVGPADCHGVVVCAHTLGPMDGRPWHSIVPLCSSHHDELDGRSVPGRVRRHFEERYEIDLSDESARIAAAWGESQA
jgi:hypothetical protein